MLDSRKRRLRISLKGDSDELRAIHQYFRREAECLLMELNVWCNSLSALAQHVRVAVSPRRHGELRLASTDLLRFDQCGDYIYKYTLTIFVLADVSTSRPMQMKQLTANKSSPRQILEIPNTDARVINSVDYVLELCSEASAMRMTVMLTWPLLIAGTFAHVHVREKVS